MSKEATLRVEFENLLKEDGFAKFSKFSWRKPVNGGFQLFVLDKSSWSHELFYPTLCFYPAECLRHLDLPAKAPKFENYPVRVRLDNFLSKDEKESLLGVFDGSQMAAEHDLPESVKWVVEKMKRSFFGRIDSLEAAVDMYNHGELPKGSVAYPVLAACDEGDPAHLVLNGFLFRKGEYLPKP